MAGTGRRIARPATWLWFAILAVFVLYVAAYVVVRSTLTGATPVYGTYVSPRGMGGYGIIDTATCLHPDVSDRTLQRIGNCFWPLESLEGLLTGQRIDLDGSEIPGQSKAAAAFERSLAAKRSSSKFDHSWIRFYRDYRE